MNKPNFMMRLISFVMALLIINGNAYAARTTTYYHVDALGSVVAASNEAGQVVWRKHYAPFGEQLDSAPNKDRIAYTGKPHDSAIGLTYFGARSYDPEIGRFTSVDPVSPAAGNGANFNDYSYARNNPYKYVDPDGRFIWFAVVFLVFALTASDAANTPVPHEVPQPVGGAARWALPALVPIRAPAVKPPPAVLVDSSVTTGLKADATLGGRILPGEVGVKSYVTIPEMTNAVTHGSLKGVPKAAYELPTLTTQPTLNMRINIRGMLPSGAGRFGDGVIGAQAVENRIPLITNDKALKAAVDALGGTTR